MPAAPPNPRAILHVDLDAFFASVEQLDNPSLRGMPVLVGGEGSRGVVAAASYEARAFGCHSAMPSAVARRLCPHAVFVKGSFARYHELSERVFAVFEEFTPLVQPVSIDEAFLDVTGSVRLLGEPAKIAADIRARVKSETGLTASVGVAPNKFLAKLASDLRKPDALVVLEAETYQSVLDPLPVGKIMGVGPAAEKSLARLGIRTIADLRAADLEVLRARFRDYGDTLHRLSRGLDDRVVHTDRGAKTISHEQTFGANLGDPDEVRAVLVDQAEQVGRRLRRARRVTEGETETRASRFARTVTIKIRFGEFETVTRSETLETATNSTREIIDASRRLFDAWARSFRPVRLIGCGVSQLSDAPGETGLFGQDDAARGSAIDKATDLIAEKFGKRAVTRARAIKSQPRHGAHGPGSDTPTGAED